MLYYYLQYNPAQFCEDSDNSKIRQTLPFAWKEYFSGCDVHSGIY